MIQGIPSYQVDFDRLRPFLENFVSRDLDGMTVEEYENLIRAKERQVWIVDDWRAVILTMVTREAVRVVAGMGEGAKEWQAEAQQHLREWAKALGKKRFVLLARPGWAKYARQHGYRERHRELVIEV